MAHDDGDIIVLFVYAGVLALCVIGLDHFYRGLRDRVELLEAQNAEILRKADRP
jgi:hypothetical protein